MLKLFNYFYKTMKLIIQYKEIKSFTIIWTQIEKNMVETPNKTFDRACKTDKDCPKLRGVNVRCRKDQCVTV
ncbi:hypothetical protein MtrunA17_Chr4g0007581 [Medicago truncatula]|uniref:Nodule Cysteine-Rich (NCR) secreted peptide n=1 Tax=Medicago truncatula TaxID=3880 RepID=A0A396HZZ5_MEDTR|nr:hypothetical protein MtrunA17_Chr4g0007581 [Medicago truncatula]